MPDGPADAGDPGTPLSGVSLGGEAGVTADGTPAHPTTSRRTRRVFAPLGAALADELDRLCADKPAPRLPCEQCPLPHQVRVTGAPSGWGLLCLGHARLLGEVARAQSQAVAS